MTEPTDAELDELRQANGGKLNFVTFSEFRTIARAVLAKWGAPPAVAGKSGEIAQQLEYLLLETENKQHPHMGAVAFLEACEAFILDHGADVLNLLSCGPTQAQAGAVPQCWCLTCRPMRLEDPYSIRMALCPTCGNKRCPKANDHRNECTGSNEPGQPGSAYAHGITGGQHGAE